MSFKYELIVNGKVKRTISKCWTSLLFVEIMKDIMRVNDMGKDKSTKTISYTISRTSDEIEF